MIKYGQQIATLKKGGVAAWLARTSGVTTDLGAITYSAALSLWIAVGLGGVILTSPDAQNWTQRSSGTTNDLFGVACNGSTIVAVGASGTCRYSVNGISWAGVATGGVQLNGICWGAQDGLFVAVGNSGRIVTSATGTASWTSRTSNVSAHLHGVFHDGSNFVAMGESGSITTSVNGTSWVSQTGATSNILLAGLYSPTAGLYVTGGGSGTTARVQTSNTAASGTMTWTLRGFSGTTSYISGFAYDAISGITYATTYTALVGYCTDLINWQVHPTAQAFYGIAINAGLIVAVGPGGKIYSSA